MYIYIYICIYIYIYIWYRFRIQIPINHPGNRLRAKREHLKRGSELPPENRSQNLVLTVFHVPHWLDGGCGFVAASPRNIRGGKCCSAVFAKKHTPLAFAFCVLSEGPQLDMGAGCKEIVCDWI